MRHRLTGLKAMPADQVKGHWTELSFEVRHLSGPELELRQVKARAVVLALGGGSWARLGSDGAWAPWLAQMGVPVNPLRPANCGFHVAARDAWVGRHFSWRVLRGSRSSQSPSSGSMPKGISSGARVNLWSAATAWKAV
jgi:predicted flavoprotein YhiN